MYEILRRSPARPWALATAVTPLPPMSPDGNKVLVLHLRENRSPLSEPARQTVAAIALLLAACTILPALKGLWLVPVYALGTLAALTFALECHARSQPASETLTFAEGHIRYRGTDGQATNLPCRFTRLDARAITPASLRLFLRHRDQSVEIGRCLGLEERRALIPTIAAALAQAREAPQ